MPKLVLGASLIILLAPATHASAEWNEKVLYSFQGGSDGQVPAGRVIFDKAGNLYGATAQGRADNCAPVANCGTVFELSPPAKQGDSWTEAELYVFEGKAYNDGDSPSSGLLMDKAATFTA